MVIYDGLRVENGIRHAVESYELDGDDEEVIDCVLRLEVSGD